jgi:hypothetical protein
VRGVKAAVNINVLDSCAFVCVYVRLRAYAHVDVRRRACTFGQNSAEMRYISYLKVAAIFRLIFYI